MARIRTVKPEVRRSRTVTSWPRDVRLTWVYLFGYLDDAGRGEDDLALLRAELYPRDRDVTDEVLDGWLWIIATCKEEPPLCRYTVSGEDYLHAVNWREHQVINKASASKNPPCPKHDSGANGEVRGPVSPPVPLRLTEHSGSPTGTVTEASVQAARVAQ